MLYRTAFPSVIPLLAYTLVSPYLLFISSLRHSGIFVGKTVVHVVLLLLIFSGLPVACYS
jgi:hypothetical protein